MVSLHECGAADMKGSLASMIAMVEQFIAKHPITQAQSVSLVSRRWKKGPFINGTVRKG